MSQGIIFTAAPLPPNRTSSPLFKEVGANGLAPCEAARSKISLINTTFAAFYKSFALMWTVILSLANNTEYKLDTLVSGLISLISMDVPALFPTPPMLISLKDPSEAKHARLVGAGFVVKSQSPNKTRIYTGSGTIDNIKLAVKEEAATNASCPTNYTSVDGVVSLNIINRILHYAFMVASNPTRYNPNDIDGTTPTATAEWKITEANLHSLVPERGFFFPYFDGLCLPDRSFPIVWITQTFSMLLGTTPKMIAQNATTLSRGWSTLNDTPSGRIISHMVFVLSLAMSSNSPIRPVYLYGEYVGCVVQSSAVAVMTTFGVFPPGKKETLLEGINKFMSHDAALKEIAEIISTLLTKDDKKSIISAEALLSPRHIHNEIRSRQYESRHQSSLLAAARKTRFRQTLWSAGNPVHVQQAVMHIVNGTFPDSEVPINLMGDGLFTTDPIYSVLAAFDVKCPSLIGTGNQMALGVARDMYTKVDKPAKLPGLPVFYKGIQQAHEDWKMVISSTSVWFVSGGVDKEKRLKVKGIGMSIPHEEETAKSIVGLLASLKKGKRVREDIATEPTDDQKEEARKAKKKRESAYQDLFEASTSMVIDTSEPDFFA